MSWFNLPLQKEMAKMRTTITAVATPTRHGS
jgi:hypothetical protein